MSRVVASPGFHRPQRPQPLPDNTGSPPLPRDFRKLPLSERRSVLFKAIGQDDTDPDSFGLGDRSEPQAAWSDVMVESSIGFLPVPLGVATGFLIDGVHFNIPLAVEEPSVIAAATYAGTLIAGCGGFQTWATEPEMVAQVYLEGVTSEKESLLASHESEIIGHLDPVFASMRARGGGYRGMEVVRVEGMDLLRVDLRIDVRDSMGANLINTAAEHIRGTLEELSGGSALMCILTNEALHRRAGASFSLPVSRLRRGRYRGEEAARRIAAASRLAQVDPSRAVTHNKGVMNGISSLALATGNDTRGIEAAVHQWASRDGHYRGVTTFHIEGNRLVGEAEVPLPFASVGGSVGFHPSTRTALRILGKPDAKTLARVAAALGLAQNFAAVFALATEGIQKGHMKMHSARLALLAGARDDEVRAVAERISRDGQFTVDAARMLLDHYRSEKK